MKFLTAMVISNNKHKVANRSQQFILLLKLTGVVSGASAISSHITQRNKQFVLLLELTDAVSGASAVSSHVTTKFSVRLFEHVQFFRYLPVPQSSSHSQVHWLEFQA